MYFTAAVGIKTMLVGCPVKLSESLEGRQSHLHQLMFMKKKNKPAAAAVMPAGAAVVIPVFTAASAVLVMMLYL